MNQVQQIVIDALMDLDPNRIDGNSRNAPKNVRLVGDHILFEVAGISYRVAVLPEIEVNYSC